jgi:hypothetical protein
VTGGSTRVSPGLVENITVAEVRDRELHLVKRALAIAILAIERQPSLFQSSSDQADMGRGKAVIGARLQSRLGGPICRAPA